MEKAVPYEARYRQATIDLVLPIQQREFGVTIELHQQPDLIDIPAFFAEPASGFWLALDGEDVVGTIALKVFSSGQAALRKMFVRSDYRGTGVAAALLEKALAHARLHGLTDIFLGTTEAYLAAHAFYAKHGFTEIEADTLPKAFPHVAVDTRFFHISVCEPQPGTSRNLR